MLPVQSSLRLFVRSCTSSSRCRCFVHPVRSIFMRTAVLAHASTPVKNQTDTTTHVLDGSGGCGPGVSCSNDTAAERRLQLPLSHDTNASVCYYDTFILSNFDLHLVLLEEAHHKHGVWLNVPPQLAPRIPNVGPPAVPDPIYPDAQRVRLDAMTAAMTAVRSRNHGATAGSDNGAELIRDSSCLAYSPTHGPPPFSTTGTRALWFPEMGPKVPSMAGVSPATSSSPLLSRTAVGTSVPTTQGLATACTTKNEVHHIAIRKPVDESMTCHCSECGRAFRRRHIAEQHVQLRHGQKEGSCSVTQPMVLDGPGPGEIIGYEDRVVSVATSAIAATRPTPTHEGHSLPVDAAAGATGKDVVSEAATSKDVAGTPSAGKSSTFVLSASYHATPRVELPEDSLIDLLLDEVWDDVALARDDIEKPSDLPTTRADIRKHTKRGYDTCQGRFFIPSVLFVEGKADNRDEMDAAAGRPAARATPEGAAPGIKRWSLAASSQPSSASISRLLLTQRRNADGTLGAGRDGAGGIGGGALGTAPTAQELSIAELSRHYPNPFGDSPNATLVESEKEPINPFVDLEGQAAAAAKRSAASAESSAPGGGAASEAAPVEVSEGDGWLSRWTARPYACPLCQRRALPDLTRVMASFLPSSLATGRDSRSSAAASAMPTAGIFSSSMGTRSHPGSGGNQAAVASVGTVVSAAADVSTPNSEGGATRLGSAGTQTLVEDVVACSWYNERVPRFRLLDSLEDHLESEHPGHSSWCGKAAVLCDDGCDSNSSSGGGGGGGRDVSKAEVLSDEDWRRLYNIARHRPLLVRAELLAVQQAYRITFPQQCRASSNAVTPAKDGAPSCANEVCSDTALGCVEGAAACNPTSGTAESSSGESSASASATDVPQVHVRSAVNTVLIGAVRDVQEGFIGATRILQYVLAVRNTSTESVGVTCAGATRRNVKADTEEGEEEGEGRGVADSEEDLIVVRCIGDLVPVAMLKQQVRLGSTVFVTGSLRMNRNVDTVSRRSHAYPYVQVVPPLGCVRVLGA